MPAENGVVYPLVSVIIRSMDRPTLSTALNSVAAQTYPNIEIIIVNAIGKNHSVLNTESGNHPIRITGNQESMNRCQAANIGLHAATGNYLIFLDDDDWFLPHHIEKLQQILSCNEAAIAAYAGIQCINEDGEEIYRYTEEFDPIQLRIENFIPIHAALFKRQALFNGAHFDASLDLCEDWDFWLQLAEMGDFKFIPEIGAVYRIQRGAGSGIRDNKVRTRQVMNAIYRKWIPRWSDDTLWSVLEYARYHKVAIAKEHARLQLEQIAADRDHQIVALMNSTSWRITLPMRAISSFFKKIWPN